jgi:hypothetical protein
MLFLPTAGMNQKDPDPSQMKFVELYVVSPNRPSNFGDGSKNLMPMLVGIV